MSRPIRIFVVCLVNLFLFQYLKYETSKVAVRIKPSVRIYPTLFYLFPVPVFKNLNLAREINIICERVSSHTPLQRVKLSEALEY